MKYFVPRANKPFDNLERFTKLSAKYRRHLEQLRGVLPDRVLELAKPSGMEDALMIQVEHDRALRSVRLVLRCGDLQMGYYDLIVDYEEAELLPKHDVALAKVARSTESDTVHDCDLAYHELDALSDGRIVHRYLFHANKTDSGGWLWFSIRCRALDWRREPKSSRELPPSNDRYPGGPQT